MVGFGFLPTNHESGCQQNLPSKQVSLQISLGPIYVWFPKTSTRKPRLGLDRFAVETPEARRGRATTRRPMQRWTPMRGTGRRSRRRDGRQTRLNRSLCENGRHSK